MNVWLLSHNFPPEVNALANRSYEHAVQWAEDGGSVDVITDIPHFPEGRVYRGYKNRFQHETVEGVSVYRVPIYAARNQRRLRRIASYLSYMVSAILFSCFIKRRPDVVVASSPHIFTAFAGYAISLIRRVPFVMEVRDLWPESIGAVGAIEKRWILRLIEWAVDFLYARARLVVVVTESFREALLRRGVPAERLQVVPNGADLKFLQALDRGRQEELREKLRLNGKFVVSYLGTIGMAHKVEVMLEAALRCTDPEVIYLVAGTGARRSWLEAEVKRNPCPNFLLLPKQPRDAMPYLLALSDVCVIHLMDRELFSTVIPSKLFEAMGAGRPVIVAIPGESTRLIEESGAGLVIPPEMPDALVAAVAKLKTSPDQLQAMQTAGLSLVRSRYNRVSLARRLWRLLSEALSI